MVVYDLKAFAGVMRKRLQASLTQEKANEIAIEIRCATHPNGTFLSISEQNKVVYYIKYGSVNDGSGRILLQESDNSEFLRLVAIVADIIKEVK